MKLTRINRNLQLKEPEGGIYFGTDSLLLADFMSCFRSGTAVDLGTGSGIIPLLLLSGGARADITGIEIQKEYCDIANINSFDNGYSDKFRAVLGNIRDIKSLYESGRADVVFSNPPYLKEDSGKKNLQEHKGIAFHEILCDINDICKAAYWCLKSGGRFFAVYRPERLTSMLSALRENRLEPKRLTFVCPSAGKKPSLFLIEAKKDAKEGLNITENLYIYTDSSHREYSNCMKRIYKEFE